MSYATIRDIARDLSDELGLDQEAIVDALRTVPSRPARWADVGHGSSAYESIARDVWGVVTDGATWPHGGPQQAASAAR